MAIKIRKTSKLRNNAQLIENLADFKNRIGSANPDQKIVTKPAVLLSRVSEKTRNIIMLESMIKEVKLLTTQT